MKPTLPDTPGFLTRMRVFGDLIEQFFLFAQSKLECPLSFFSSDAHFHSLAWLPFTHPPPERPWHVSIVPIHNNVPQPQPRPRGRAAVVNPADGHRPARFPLCRESEHRPFLLRGSHFKPC